MAVELPSELVEQILSRLPSKSLLRCRSVCKSWLSLISSTQFSLMHLHNVKQSKSRYLIRRFMLSESKEEYAAHFDDKYFTLDTNSPVQFPFNFHLSGTRVLFFKIIGCCNGVFCFSTDTGGRDEIILWNPSIRRKVTLIPPMYRKSDSPDLDILIGFGYLEMSDDYIVLRLAFDRRHQSITTPHAQIYTVKTAIWRAVVFPNDLASFTWPDCSLVFVNGSVHWIAWGDLDSPLSILTFDMSTELFGKILFSVSSVRLDPLRMRLSVVKDHLAMIYSCRYSTPWYSSSTYEIWVMKEYKKPNSWTMICKVHCPDMGRALAFTNNCNLITVGSTEGDVMICNREGCDSLYGSPSEGIDSEYTFVERYQESLG